jgi:hypothetical protein
MLSAPRRMVVNTDVSFVKPDGVMRRAEQVSSHPETTRW